MRPGYRMPTRIEARVQVVTVRRAILRVLDVVFPRPDHFHGRSDRLRRRERLRDEIELEAPAEPTAEVCRVYRDLLGWHAADLRAGHLDAGLELRRRPDIHAVGAHVRGAVHRLHG